MKALLVDETSHVCERLTPSLEQQGYIVRGASSPGEARWIAGELEADVVVICSARPGIHDVPLIEGLRSDGERAPILVLTRHAESRDTVAALDAGADDVVVSPVPFSEVAARLRALSRRGHELAVQDPCVGTLRLDTKMRAAIREDAEGRAHAIELSPREYLLLEQLMTHAGHVLTRAQLFDEVWGPEIDDASNLVDQVVSLLRAKVDRPYGRNDIATVRGMGYRITDSEKSVMRRAS